MPEGFHPPVEEYLEAILEVGEEGAEVIQARLVERLGHSAPSVSETVRRLIDEGFVERSGRTLVLTPRGKRRAEGVVRKHRLAELLLTEVIGLPWHKAHLEAGRWEHVISDEVEERLDRVARQPAHLSPRQPDSRRRLHPARPHHARGRPDRAAAALGTHLRSSRARRFRPGLPGSARIPARRGLQWSATGRPMGPWSSRSTAGPWPSDRRSVLSSLSAPCSPIAHNPASVKEFG